MIEEKSWLKRFRFLILMLIVSGALNIFLVIFFLYFNLQDKNQIDFEIVPIKKESVKKELTNGQYLSFIYKLSFRELVSLLANKKLVEEGYTRRDLALGCLVSFYDFNIEKALTNKILQRRKVVFTINQEDKELILIAGLKDHHYESIIHYALTEKWSLTSKGLYSLLNKWEKPREASLEKAFMVTDDFYLVANLFNQEEGFSINPEDILDLLCECSWPFIQDFLEKQKQTLDFTKEYRLQFLLNCLEENSKKASELLLKTDFLYAVKRLPDEQILKILSLLDKKTDDLQKFCTYLLKRARSDIIWKKAAEKIYSFSKQTSQELMSEQTEMINTEDFVNTWQNEEEKDPSLRNVIWGEESLDKDVHIVKEGENLWKIARIYKVDIEELMRVNNLQTDTIHPGVEILIPQDR